MIKCFHEAPKSMFNEVQRITAGDYALVHLFEKDPEYYNMFKKAVAKGREVILDNSIFELGKAFDAEKYAEWISRLKPTYYIVPDVLEDGPATTKQFFDFIKMYPGLPGEIIGVAQGKSKKEFIECYKAIEPYCDVVAISFDYSWLITTIEDNNKWVRLYRGRQKLLLELESEGIINTDKPHHLLGIALPQEIRLYGDLQRLGRLQWIHSVDTSNPVVHGLKGVRYKEYGLTRKETQKLCTLIDAQPTGRERDIATYNIKKFRGWAHGK